MSSDSVMKVVIVVVCVLALSAMGYGIYNIVGNDTEPAGGGTGDSNRVAVITTNYGVIKVELYEDKAPETTANFIELANDGFYDGLCFHRVIDDFMIQGGGFTQEGRQYTSDQIPFESDPDLQHVDGAISMASTGAGVGGSCQFFICDGDQHFLDGNYAVFGQVVSGMDVVRAISAVETHTNPDTGMADWPVDEVRIESVRIVG